MAQTGYTPIQLYFSSTTTNVPLAANLASGELAINITDGKLFYKDNANAIQVIGWKTTPATAGGTGFTSYTIGDILVANSTTSLSKLADVVTGNALISGGVGAVPSWGKIGLTTHISGVLPVANGGTNLSSATTGDLIYASATNTWASLADVATGNALISGGVGVAPSYGKIGLTTHVSGTLPVANGGTNLTSFTSGGVVYASSTSALATGSDLQFTGGNLLVGSTSSYSGNKQITVVGAGTARGAVVMARTTAATSGVAGSLLAYNATDVICGMDFQSNGANNSGYIGTYTYNAGAFAQGPYLNTGGTSWTTASDSRLKTIDGPITNALDKISTLLGLIGTMKSDPTQTKRAFLLAQDVQQVLPEIVTTDANGFFGIQYEGMIPLIVNAINELQQQIKKLA